MLKVAYATVHHSRGVEYDCFFLGASVQNVHRKLQNGPTPLLFDIIDGAAYEFRKMCMDEDYRDDIMHDEMELNEKDEQNSHISFDSVLYAEDKVTSGNTIDVMSAEGDDIHFSLFLDGARLSSKKRKETCTSIKSLLQISVACTELSNKKKLTCKKKSLDTFLVTTNVSTRIQSLQRANGDTTKYQINTSKTKEEINAGQKILCENEMEMVKSVRDILKKQGYGSTPVFMMKDGLIEEYVDNDKFHAVGVSKNFTNVYPDTLINTLSHLDSKQRTPAVWDISHSPNSGYARIVWFLRLREAEEEDKLSHIVRCEMTVENKNSKFSKLCKDDRTPLKETAIEEKIRKRKVILPNPISTKMINGVSRAVLQFAYPVPYGQDSRKRWRTHLYPIFLTEAFCNSQFHTKEEMNKHLDNIIFQLKHAGQEKSK